MKKSFFALIAVLTITTLTFSGCSNAAMPSVVGERLEYTLNALENTLNSMDSIDNNYLANPDIAPVNQTNQKEKDNKLSLSLITPNKNTSNTIVTNITYFNNKSIDEEVFLNETTVINEQNIKSNNYNQENITVILPENNLDNNTLNQKPKHVTSNNTTNLPINETETGVAYDNYDFNNTLIKENFKVMTETQMVNNNIDNNQNTTFLESSNNIESDSKFNQNKLKEQINYVYYDDIEALKKNKQ